MTSDNYEIELGCSREDTIIHWASTKWWFHSSCYWDVWVLSWSFWFIFYCLCIDHYCTSLAVFFIPLDAYFLLLIAHVHNLATCTSHNDSLAGCCTWLRFLISSTHRSWCTSVTSWFVADDNSFVLGLLCYRWSSSCSQRSYLHRVFTLFLFIICFCFSFGLCLLVLSFALYFWWMGSCPWILYRVFLFLRCLIPSSPVMYHNRPFLKSNFY